jgi:hypothetical protein
MKKVLTGALAALTLGGAALSTATPAAAQPWGHRGYYGGYGGYHHRGYNSGAVLGAGILGLAVGAALASPRYYAPPRYYYAPPPAYYVEPAYAYYGPTCRVHYRWDGYWGRYVAVERCY